MKKVTLISFYLLSLFVFTAFLDFIIQFAIPEPANRAFSIENYKQDLTIRLMAQPPQSIKSKKAGFNDEIRHMEIDSYGFVKPSIVHDKPDVEIFFLGGSTTEVFDVKPELRFPYLVSTYLEESGVGKVNGINAGLSGKHSVHSLHDLLSRGALVKPDYVVMMHVVNDLTILMHTGEYFNSDLQFSHNRSYMLRSKDRVDQLELYGRFGMLVQGVKNAARAIYPNAYQILSGALSNKAKPADDEFKKYRNVAKKLDQDKISSAFRESLNRFVYSACSLGIEPVLMTQPNRIENRAADIRESFEEINPLIDFDDYAETYSKMNDVVRSVAQAHNITLIDAASAIPQKEDYIFDAVHFTDKGSQEMAKYISEQLKPVIGSDQAKTCIRAD